MGRKSPKEVFYDLYEIDAEKAEKERQEKLEEAETKRKMRLRHKIAEQFRNPRTFVGKELQESSRSYSYLLPIAAALVIALSLVRYFGDTSAAVFLQKHIALPIFVIGWLVLGPKLLGKRTKLENEEEL